MKRISSIALVLILVAIVSSAQEQDQKSNTGVSAWLKALQSKIAQIMPKKTVPMTTGVAGVRGAKEDAFVKLYWKGKKGDETVSEEEMAKFKACLDLAEKGNRDESLRQLEEFMKVYPDSALIPDAKKTFDLVKAEPTAEPVQQASPQVKVVPVSATNPKAEEKLEKKDDPKRDEKADKPAELKPEDSKEIKQGEKK